MGFYQNRIVPHLVNLAMSNRDLVPYRRRVLAGAEGRVLEIGIGSGLNLPFYGSQVRELFAVDPSPRLLEMARRAGSQVAWPVALIEGSAEAIPLETGSFDTVVTTWTLCSIPAVDQALKEMRRVLKPDGKLLFVEHGLAPEPRVCRWQNRLTPLWKRLAGGCHINRPIRSLIERAGFSLMQIETGYAPRGPKPMVFMYEGSARPSKPA
jgi:ubiquinone/menaquinone biosynthesis C-methylase UbiE